MRTRGKVLPGLLALLGAVGTVVAIGCAITESPKAYAAKKEEEERREAEGEEEMTLTETAKVMLPYYKKTIVAELVAIGGITGGYISAVVTIGALGSSVYMWQSKALDFDRALNRLSPEMRKKLHIDQAREAIKKKLDEGSKDLEKPKKKLFEKDLDHAELFPIYEGYSKQVIWTSRNRKRNAEEYIYRAIAQGREANLYRVLMLLGAKKTPELESFKHVGWSIYGEQEEYFYQSEDGMYVNLITDVADEDSLRDKEVLCLYYSIPPVALDLPEGEVVF